MFTSTFNVFALFVLALTRQSKADSISACGLFSTIGSGFDTSGPFSIYLFPAETSPVDTTNGTALGITSDNALGVVRFFFGTFHPLLHFWKAPFFPSFQAESPLSFLLNDGTLSSATSSLTAPLLVDGATVGFAEANVTASQFCLIVRENVSFFQFFCSRCSPCPVKASTSPEGGSVYPIIGVNGTIDRNFALCESTVVFRPTDSTGCKFIDLRMIL